MQRVIGYSSSVRVTQYSDCVTHLRGNGYALLISTLLWLEGHWLFKDLQGGLRKKPQNGNITSAFSTKPEHHKWPPFSHQEKWDTDCQSTRFKDNNVYVDKVLRILTKEKFYASKMWLSLGTLWSTETVIKANTRKQLHAPLTITESVNIKANWSTTQSWRQPEHHIWPITLKIQL